MIWNKKVVISIVALIIVAIVTWLILAYATKPIQVSNPYGRRI